jgi:hypothetical protein
VNFLGVSVSALLVALAWQYAGTWPRHRPVAVFLSVALAADLVHWALGAFVLQPARAMLGTAPYGGIARAAFHVQQGTVLAWPFGLAALAAWVFLEEPLRRHGAVLAGALWTLSSLGLALAYPAIRGDVLGRAYLAVELAALAAVIATGVGWWQRVERPSLVEGTVIILGAVELGAILQWSPFVRGWEPQVIAYFVAYGALIFVHMGELWPLWQQKSR